MAVIVRLLRAGRGGQMTRMQAHAKSTSAQRARPCASSHAAASNAASYARIAHAGAGVVTMCASGSELAKRTTATIHINSDSLIFAIPCATAPTGAAASCARPRSIVMPTTGTTRTFASGAYGVKTRKVAAVSGQVPIWVAKVSASASFTLCGRQRRSSARASGGANKKIAPPHENESANEIGPTELGHPSAMAMAAAANAFQEKG